MERPRHRSRPSRRGKAAPRRPITRRAMTFLEVVFATIILAMIVSVLFGSIGYMLGRQRVEQRTLGAVEVANRLMLQYLDDFTAMPDESLPVAYGPDRYRWHKDTLSFRLEPAEPASRQRQPPPGDRAGGTLLEKSDLVVLTVWLSEESGGSFSPDPGVPQARVSRLVYPFLAGRNPDSWANAQNNDAYMQSVRERMVGGGGGGGTPRGPKLIKSDKGAAPAKPAKTGGKP